MLGAVCISPDRTGVAECWEVGGVSPGIFNRKNVQGGRVGRVEERSGKEVPWRPRLWRTQKIRKVLVCKLCLFFFKV